MILINSLKVILHGGVVDQDYKELTVNIATLHNDIGTVLSGCKYIYS